MLASDLESAQKIRSETQCLSNIGSVKLGATESLKSLLVRKKTCIQVLKSNLESTK